MKRGSALLIVLGMIAFMVISAVAFSALMRNSRLPSSYLRRTSASRHLVKAALAEAIDIIDASIGNDLYPGADDNGTAWSYPRGEGGYIARRNYWRGNCFIGSNQLASASSTISTLSLEGLAYLPPARINEARYYSRHSLAGQWRALSFDAGRYAFAAVDVSDHLDINRVFADRGRNSSDSGRITLAHIFENDAHTGSGTPSAEDWDTFIEEFNPMAGATVGQNPGSGGKLPLTSLADLNLAINYKQKGWVETMSPFCRFLNSGEEDFVRDMLSSARIRQMAFVTDSYLPSTNTAATARYDLCRAQPFNTMLRGNSQMGYDEQMQMNTPILALLNEKITKLDTVSLYDYLDENDIPSSLAIPSVEAVPMICALKPSVNFQLRANIMEPELKFNDGSTKDTPAAATSVKQETRKYQLQLENPAGQVEALCLFPFRRCGDQSVSFKAEFALRMGFTVGNGPGYRQANGGFVIAGEPDFKTEAAVENGIVKVYKQASGILNFTPRTIKSESDAFKSVTADFTPELNTVSQRFNNEPLFTVTYRYTAEKIPGSDPVKYQWVSTPDIDPTQPPPVASFFHPTAENGSGDGGFNVNYLLNSGGTCEVRPYLTVTARIVSNQSNKTVDLVPATVADDEGFNRLPIGGITGDLEAVCGSGHSLLTMSAQDTLTFSEAAWAQNSKPVGFLPTASGGVYVCPDPRWNFAPQNFYISDGSALPDASSFVQSLALGSDGRDNDIFLAVSNQGYMQSPSELAFLPRTTTARLPIGNDVLCDPPSVALDSPPALVPGGANPYGQLAHGALMWKTYRLYARNGMNDDNLYDLGIRYEGSGYRVSPYASSRDVLMAALANTPYSWWAASTNLSANANLADESAETFNRSYAFNEMNSNAKFAWSDLESVAANLLDAMRRRADGNWALGFHNLDWEGDNSDFCGVNFQGTNADELKDVDRKMLYGFWRDSLAARQQLFLIFVRAEPMMMGGGAIGQTPPQLGARAVALVWRDPTPTARDVAGNQPRPHQTRILFYRQFD